MGGTTSATSSMATNFDNQLQWDQSWQNQYGDEGQSGNWGYDASGKMTHDIGGDAMNSSFGSMDSTLGTLGKIGGIAGSLGNIYVGLQSLGIAKDELKLKKDQWKMAKGELNHLQGTRKHITQSYMA